LSNLLHEDQPRIAVGRRDRPQFSQVPQPASDDETDADSDWSLSAGGITPTATKMH
jgi:hypothetical protein